MRIILRILGNSLAIFLADYFVAGINFTGGTLKLFLAGLALGIINSFLKPLLKFITAPIIAFTFGFFLIIINMFLLWLLTILMPELVIENLEAYFWGTIIISTVNLFVGLLTKKRNFV